MGWGAEEDAEINLSVLFIFYQCRKIYNLRGVKTLRALSVLEGLPNPVSSKKSKEVLPILGDIGAPSIYQSKQLYQTSYTESFDNHGSSIQLQ